jgi:hypothetical protein
MHGHVHTYNVEDYMHGPVVATPPVATSAGALNIRSGAAGQHSIAAMAAPFEGVGTITSISFSYQFTIGYGTNLNSTGASIALGYTSNLDCPTSGTDTMLYTSPRYLEPSYDKCHSCYSDPVPVALSGLNLTTADVGALAFHFDNGDHNMQVLLPIKITLGWQK